MSIEVFVLLLVTGLILMLTTFMNPEKEDLSGQWKKRCVLLVSFMLTLCAHNKGFHEGRHDLLTDSDLEQGVIYEAVSEPVSYRRKQGGTMDYVFLSLNGGDPKAYFLDSNDPPQRFIVITNSKGRMELLPRPLPKEEQKNPTVTTNPETE